MQTQRQLQTSLEAHGQYISSLIAPEATAAYLGTEPDALLEGLPPLEAVMGQEGREGRSPQPPAVAGGLQEWRQGSTWELGHSSATGRVQPPHFPLVPSSLLSTCHRRALICIRQFSPPRGLPYCWQGSWACWYRSNVGVIMRIGFLNEINMVSI